jgi:restriction system protein
MATKSDLPPLADYLPPLVAALKARGGSATVEELEEDVARLMKLTDEQRAIEHGSGNRTYFEYRLAWARSYLKKAGVIDNSERGVWQLTPKGATMSEAELRAVVSQVRAENRRTRLGRTVSDEEDEGAGIPEPEISWKERLLGCIGNMSAAAFERLCQRLLREAGFIKVEVTGRSGDGGIDGIGILRVHLVSFQVVFQSKRWKGSVGAGVVRDFRGGMIGRADKGLIITTGTFTPEARREATRDGAPAIDLVDGEALADLVKQYGLGVGVKMVEEVEIKPEFFASI